MVDQRGRYTESFPVETGESRRLEICLYPRICWPRNPWSQATLKSRVIHSQFILSQLFATTHQTTTQGYFHLRRITDENKSVLQITTHTFLKSSTKESLEILFRHHLPLMHTTKEMGTIDTQDEYTREKQNATVQDPLPPPPHQGLGEDSTKLTTRVETPSKTTKDPPSSPPPPLQELGEDSTSTLSISDTEMRDNYPYIVFAASTGTTLTRTVTSTNIPPDNRREKSEKEKLIEIDYERNRKENDLAKISKMLDEHGAKLLKQYDERAAKGRLSPLLRAAMQTSTFNDGSASSDGPPLKKSKVNPSARGGDLRGK